MGHFHLEHKAFIERNLLCITEQGRPEDKDSRLDRDFYHTRYTLIYGELALNAND